MPHWKVTGVNYPELEILLTSDDLSTAVVRKHQSNEWKRACAVQSRTESPWKWSDESRIVENKGPTLEARLGDILGDALDIANIRTAFGVLVEEINELRAKVKKLEAGDSIGDIGG